MSLPVVLRREAQAEFDKAVDWYEKQREGLGAEFLASVQESLTRISLMPGIHPVVFKDVRQSLVRRFPYGIYYRVESARIVVLAVFHSSRNPAIWKKRAK